MSVLVDTGVIVAAFNRRDGLHRWARGRLAEALQGSWGPAYTTDYIIDEVLSYAARKLGRDPAVRLGSLLLEERVLRIIPVTLDIVLDAWVLYRRHAPRLSFTDATTLAVAETYSIDYIMTVDEALAALHPSIAP